MVKSSAALTNTESNVLRLQGIAKANAASKAVVTPFLEGLAQRALINARVDLLCTNLTRLFATTLPGDNGPLLHLGSDPGSASLIIGEVTPARETRKNKKTGQDEPNPQVGMLRVMRVPPKDSPLELKYSALPKASRLAGINWNWRLAQLFRYTGGSKTGTIPESILPSLEWLEGMKRRLDEGTMRPWDSDEVILGRALTPDEEAVQPAEGFVTVGDAWMNDEEDVEE